MPRDNFTEATKRLLAERVGYKCSNPFCKRTNQDEEKIRDTIKKMSTIVK